MAEDKKKLEDLDDVQIVEDIGADIDMISNSNDSNV